VGEAQEKCLSETLGAINTTSLPETPAFMHGVPHTLHPTPYTFFIRNRVSEVPGNKIYTIRTPKTE